MHLHTLTLDIPRSTRVFCEGCDIALRLATGDEALVITESDMTDDGPMLGPLGTTVVPLDFSLFQEA